MRTHVRFVLLDGRPWDAFTCPLLRFLVVAVTVKAVDTTYRCITASFGVKKRVFVTHIPQCREAESASSRAAAGWRTSPTGPNRAAHCIQTWRSEKCVSVGQVVHSWLENTSIRPSSVLHNGAEFGHVVRPTRVESMQQKLVCSTSSGNTVLITAPLRCVHVLQSGKLIVAGLSDSIT